MSTLFSSEQLAALAAPLDRAKVRQREQGRSKVSYLEGWQVIAEANRIFGFDGWQRETMAVQCVAERERTLGSSGRSGWGVTYTARVRITVGDGAGHLVIREGSGAGHGIDADLGLAHESALKEAETDAMKRALMTFGNPFGLALYDKAQRQAGQRCRWPGCRARTARRTAASRGPAGGRHTLFRHCIPGPRPPSGHGFGLTSPGPGRPRPGGPGCPDHPAHLHNTLRALPRPQLESLTRAFRKRFQVPEEAVTIADRINQECHHDWIEAFLVQH